MAHQLTDHELAGFREAFDLFDKDRSGTIATGDLANLMRLLGRNPTDAKLQDRIAEVDADQTGFVDFPEFVSMMGHSCHDDDPFLELFEERDIEKSGLVTMEEFFAIIQKFVVQVIDVRLTLDEVLEMVRDCVVKGGVFSDANGEDVSTELLCEAALNTFKDRNTNPEKPTPCPEESIADESAEVPPIADIGIEVLSLSGAVVTSLRLNPSMSVQELQRQLEPIAMVPASKQKLMFRGKVLRQEASLRDSGLHDDAEITLVKEVSIIVNYRKFSEFMLAAS